MANEWQMEQIEKSHRLLISATLMTLRSLQVLSTVRPRMMCDEDRTKRNKMLAELRAEAGAYLNAFALSRALITWKVSPWIRRREREVEAARNELKLEAWRTG